MGDNLQLVTNAVQEAKQLSEQIRIVSGKQLGEDDALVLGNMFMAGMFKDMKSLYNAVVKASFGKRLGIDPMTAVTSCFVIDGKLGMEAKAMRNTLVMAGYTINNVTPEGDEHKYCKLEWVFDKKILGTSKFMLEDAVARGYVDSTCAKVPGFPYKHNDREISYYNKWKKPQAGWDKKMGCDCKDNWRSMLEEMMIARATSKGNTKYGNRAFKGEVYEVSELVESPFREDTTPVDVARAAITKSKDIEALQAITKGLDSDTLAAVLEDVNIKTREFLNEPSN